MSERKKWPTPGAYGKQIGDQNRAKIYQLMQEMPGAPIARIARAAGISALTTGKAYHDIKAGWTPANMGENNGNS